MKTKIGFNIVIFSLIIFSSFIFSDHLVCLATQRDVNFTDVSNIIRLRNGMEVLLIPDRSISQVASMIIVKTGYAREDEKTSGFSYLLEQLLFDGTESRTKEQLDLEIKGMGAYCSSHSEADFTSYLMLAHSAYTNKILEIQSDILFNAKIQMASMNWENSLILEKIFAKKDEIDFKLNSTFDEQLHNGTPYERGIFGNGYKLNTRDLERLKAYYHSYYVPNNMCAIIMGDIESVEIERLLEYNFGAVAPTVVPSQSQIIPAIGSKGKRLYKIEGNNGKKILRMGFDSGVNLNYRDIAALTVLREALSGEGGLLKDFFEKKDIDVFSAMADLSYNKFYGNFEIRVDFQEESNEDAVLSQIEGLISSVCDKGISKEELERAKRLLINKDIFLRETIHHYLMQKALPMATLGPIYVLQYKDLLNSISSSEIAQVADKYLSDMSYLGVLSLPYEDFSIKQKDNYKTKGKVYRQTKELLNGIKIIAERKVDSEVFAVNILANNRVAQESGGLEGVVEFMHRMFTRGAKKMNKAKIQEVLWSIGAKLNTYSDNQNIPYEFLSRDYSSICFETVQDNSKEGVNFLKNIIMHPLFPDQDIKVVKSQMKYFSSVKEEDPSIIAERILFRELLLEDTKGMDSYSSNKAIEEINKDTLKKFHKDYFAPNNLIISAVSSLAPSDTISLIESEFSEMKGTTPQIIVQKRSLDSVGKWVEKIMNISNPYILYCIPLPDLGQEDRLRMTLVASLLNSKMANDELFGNNCNVRVKFSPQINLFQVDLETKKEHITEAVNEIKNKIKSMRTVEITHENLIRSINELVGQLDIKTLSSINRASYLGFAHSIGDTHYFGQEYRQKLLAITSDQIKASVNHYLNTDSDIVVVIR